MECFFFSFRFTPIYIPLPPLHFLDIVTLLLLAKSVAALMFSAQLSHLIHQNVFFSLLFVLPGMSNCQFALFFKETIDDSF